MGAQNRYCTRCSKTTKFLVDGGIFTCVTCGVRVELQRDGKTRTPVVYTVLGPGGRWYVENLDIAAVKDFCAMAPVSPGT